jgi:hypothetical protein
MSYTVLYLSGGDFGDFDEMLVRCNLHRPASEIQVDHGEGSGWQSSGLQSAQTRGTREGLGELARLLAAQALQCDPETVECEIVDADSLPVGKRGELGLLPAPDAQTTDYTTADGLRIYDLDPLAGELCTVAGPDGIDPRGIDPNYLPEGFRWVFDDEWETAVTETAMVFNCNHCDAECTADELVGGLCERCKIVDDHLGELAKLLKGSK